MAGVYHRKGRGWLGVLAVALVAAAGCQTTAPCVPDVPRELGKVSHPDYVIEPPDVITIDALRLVPLPPYRIEALNVIAIQVTEALPEQPISGLFTVEPEGTVNLGFTYGSVRVVDLTVEQAQRAIEKHLKQIIKDGFVVVVAPAQSRAMQQVRGDHLVRADGKVQLGSYGSVRVAGLTLEEAKTAIELHLSQHLLRPQISLDVSGFNSKVYYVVTDGATNGEQVYRFPVTGNETVLDALAQINGLSVVSSKHHIWLARPRPVGGCDQVLSVNWNSIVRKGETETNYQVLPGDRIYVKAQVMITTYNVLDKIIAPVERTFGIILLGNALVQSLQGTLNFGGGSSSSGTATTP